jgi:hypothetical protein
MAVALWRSALTDADVATAGNELKNLFLQSIIYPISDIAATGWDSAPVASLPLWDMVNEATASDTDYIFAEDPNP